MGAGQRKRKNEAEAVVPRKRRARERRCLPPPFVPLTQDGSGRLPDHVWQYAFDFLSVRDKCVVRQTCKSFQALVKVDPRSIDHAKLRALEDRQRQLPYIAAQRNLNPKMRAILLDWITDVHHSLNFGPATLYRTAQISDRYLTVTENVTRDKLQLVGVTAFKIAAQEFEEAPPDADTCAYWTDNGESHDH